VNRACALTRGPCTCVTGRNRLGIWRATWGVLVCHGFHRRAWRTRKRAHASSAEELTRLVASKSVGAYGSHDTAKMLWPSSHLDACPCTASLCRSIGQLRIYIHGRAMLL